MHIERRRLPCHAQVLERFYQFEFEFRRRRMKPPVLTLVAPRSSGTTLFARTNRLVHCYTGTQRTSTRRCKPNAAERIRLLRAARPIRRVGAVHGRARRWRSEPASGARPQLVACHPASVEEADAQPTRSRTRRASGTSGRVVGSS